MFSKHDYAASLLKGSIILYPQSGSGRELNTLTKTKEGHQKELYFSELQAR
ncbi:hypothetical protein S657_003360 [Salmonella enterica subsp. enterica]|nr:hypothetical protein [Salmonella enterica subsp. enterica]